MLIISYPINKSKVLLNMIINLKKQSQLTIMDVYDLETFNFARSVPYAFGWYKLVKCQANIIVM